MLGYFSCIYWLRSLHYVLNFSYLNVIQDNKYSPFPLSSFSTSILICFYSLTYRFAIKPVTLVSSSVGPNLNSVALWLALTPLSVVDLAIGELAFAFQEFTFLPLTLENSTVGQGLFAVSSRFAVDPSALKNSAIR